MDQMNEKERMLRTCSWARLTVNGRPASEGGLSLLLSLPCSRSVIDTWPEDRALPTRDPEWDRVKLRTLLMLLLRLLARLMVE